MAAIFFLFRLSIFFLSSTFTSPASSSSSSSPPSYPDGRSYRIDCGSLSVSIDSFNTTWLSEGLFTGGAISPVSEPLRFRQTHEKTLRYFPLSSSEKTATPSPICPPADTSSAHSPCTTTTMANPTPPPSTSPSWALSSFPEAPLCPMTSPEPAHTRIYSLSSPTPTPMSASTALPMTLP
ncbi:flocculation protein FLO11-like [Malus sylvestris]|uniref:flocculation protein FLO11-like n=1 Tax=Malus sylvestris TaxID=3752 RepID=UPI0021AD1431|nr:flocculation protein FLO11-like [Malus sylvestris]